jgi:hypothetical protein
VERGRGGGVDKGRVDGEGFADLLA